MVVPAFVFLLAQKAFMRGVVTTGVEKQVGQWPSATEPGPADPGRR